MVLQSLKEDAIKQKDYQLFLALDTLFRKQCKKNSEHKMLQQLDENLDERSRHMGLRALKKGYQPRPFARKRKQNTVRVTLLQHVSEWAGFVTTHHVKHTLHETPEHVLH